MESTLETVLAALSASSEQREQPSTSFTFLTPIWKPAAKSEGESPAAISISRLAISPDQLQLNAKNEESLIAALKSHTDPSSTPAAIDQLHSHLHTLRTFDFKRIDHVGLSTRISHALIQDRALHRLLKSKCGALSRRLITEILKWSLRVRFWEPVQTLAESGCVSAVDLPELVDQAVEIGDVRLVCMFISCVPDIQPKQWLQILRLFLSHPVKTHDSFRAMRGVWRGLITGYFEKAASSAAAVAGGVKKVQHRDPTEVAGCIRLAAAYDGFSASEMCMHLVVAAKHDEAVLGVILGELEGGEVVKLLRYLNKWLEKYCNRLVHVGQVKRDERRLVPSLKLVLRCVGGLLEGRYASVVLDQSLSREVAVTQKLVNSLVDVGKKAGSLEAVVQHLLAKKALPSDKPGSGGAEHIIEYLEFS